MSSSSGSCRGDPGEVMKKPKRRMQTKIFPGLITSRARAIQGVPTSTAAFIGPSERGPINKPVRITTVTEFQSLFGHYGPRVELGYTVHQFFQNGGREAWIVRVAGTGRAIDVVGNARKRTGLYSLENVDSFNLLCIPSLSHLPARAMDKVLAQVVRYCEHRRAFLLMDTPVRIRTVNGVKSWLKQRNALRHPNVALYSPRVRIANPMTSAPRRAVGACGAIAGVYARTDSTRGVWKAPAGTEAQLLGVAGLEYNLIHSEINALGALAVNCLRVVPKHGSVVWGARTLMGADHLASEWKYIPVRRVALFIEESIYRGTQWVVFEPNDATLWARIRSALHGFLTDLFRMGAFAGRTPQQSYFVKCDSQTTSQADIRRGIVNLLVGFAPLKPAEFIIIRISQRTTPRK